MLSSDDFLINIYAGLAIFILEVAILVFLIPLLIKRADDKKWAYARKGIAKAIREESDGLQIAIYRIVESKGRPLAEIKAVFANTVSRFQAEGELASVAYMTAAMTPKLTFDLADLVGGKANVRIALTNFGAEFTASLLHGDERAVLHLHQRGEVEDIARFMRNFNGIRLYGTEEAAQKSRERIVMPLVRTMERAGMSVDITDVR